MSIPQYLAGRVRRWHTLPTVTREDTVATHSWHVATLIAYYHPEPSAALLCAALWHDCGEYLTGDLARPFKRSLSPGAAQELNDAEVSARAQLGLKKPYLSQWELDWLEEADLLSALYFLYEEAAMGNIHAKAELVRYRADGEHQWRISAMLEAHMELTAAWGAQIQ